MTNTANVFDKKRSRAWRPDKGIGDIEHLKQQVKEAGVNRGVLVQTGTAYQWDNRLVVDVSSAHADWMVGVCNLNPAAPKSVDELEGLVRSFNITGLRVELVERLGFYHKGSDRLWQAARHLGVAICAHIECEHSEDTMKYLNELAILMGKHPDVLVTLDHCAYPSTEKGIDSYIVKKVTELTRFQHLYLKLTFAIISSTQDDSFSDTHPLVNHFIKTFGPDRCMWGSDFPCEHGMDKQHDVKLLNIFREELGLSRAQQEAILGETPMRLWFDR